MAFSKVDAFSIKTGGVYNYIRIKSFFNVVKVINTGASFGMFDRINCGQIILSTITAILICVLYVLL
jgi:lipoprotein signal peptidase